MQFLLAITRITFFTIPSFILKNYRFTKTLNRTTKINTTPKRTTTNLPSFLKFPIVIIFRCSSKEITNVKLNNNQYCCIPLSIHAFRTYACVSVSSAGSSFYFLFPNKGEYIANFNFLNSLF